MKPTFDLYPVLKAEFDKDPGMTSIDISSDNGVFVRRITRAEFERERLTRDMFRLLKPIGKVS